MAGVIFPDDIDFSVYENETEAKQNVRKASVYVQSILDRVTSGYKERHAFMPWYKTRTLLQFRPGEVTVWGGPNGSGKSLVTGQTALALCNQGEKVCIASFEMKPDKTLERMGRQWTHHSLRDKQAMAEDRERRIIIDLYEQFRDWTDDKLWLYDQQGTVQWKKVCAVVRYCAKELGITHFFVDNLMKCVAGEDDYNGQKAFVDELTAIARDHSMHIHLVHHIKKPSSDEHLPTKYDFKGTGAITDQPDNVIAVWRNKPKERAKQGNRTFDANQPDAKLVVDKQRNGEGWEGVIGLWYHPESQQFLADAAQKPAQYYTTDEGED